MKKIRTPKKTLVSMAIASMFTGGLAHAGGFSLYTEGSAAAIGNFAAGVAAEVVDASIGWYNPAGLPFLDKQQAVISGVGVFPSAKLSGTSTFTTTSAVIPPAALISPYVQTFNNLQASRDALVPAFHYALPLSDKTTFGLSIVSPFGLSTEYATNSPVRYAATFTELVTVNISPEFGTRLTENFSVGAGLDLQWSQVKFNQMIGAPTLALFGTTVDSLSYNKGKSQGVGFHAGVLGVFNDNHSRIGLNYQSKMTHTYKGFSRLSGPLADTEGFFTDGSAVVRNDGLFSNQIQLPDILTLSGYQDVNEQWALLGSVVYTGWSVFERTTLNNALVPVISEGTLGTASSTAIQDYRNAWRFSVGANYKASDQWLLRAGAGWDQTPTVDAERDVRLPDANRWALSVGTHYQARPSVGIDFGYTYLFAGDNTTINKTNVLSSSEISTSTYNVNASAKPHAHLVGLQAVWTIDQDAAAVK